MDTHIDRGPTAIRLKRVYEKPADADGVRILVDRIWPRGLRKAEAAVDLWLKDIAPSTALRKWFGHDAEKWPEFRKRYMAELDGKPRETGLLKEKSREGALTLLFAAKDPDRNNAVVLRDYIERLE